MQWLICLFTPQTLVITFLHFVAEVFVWLTLCRGCISAWYAWCVLCVFVQMEFRTLISCVKLLVLILM